MASLERRNVIIIKLFIFYISGVMGKVLQTIWDDLPQNSINKAVLSFIKRLRAYVKAGGGHFEHVFK